MFKCAQAEALFFAIVILSATDATAQGTSQTFAHDQAEVSTGNETPSSPSSSPLAKSADDVEFTPTEARDEPPDPANASALAEEFQSIEEIVVTGAAGSQNLQNLGVSVAAFDADYLDALGAQNIADIAQFTPNLELSLIHI